MTHSYTQGTVFASLKTSKAIIMYIDWVESDIYYCTDIHTPVQCGIVVSQVRTLTTPI
jgi:hypothetical protein